MRFFRGWPLKIDLIRFFESARQTTRAFALCPEYFGTDPLLGSGKNAWRSGWAAATLASSPKAPSRTSSVHTLLIRTATYTILEPLESAPVLSRFVGLILLVLLVVPSGAAAAKPRVQHIKFKYGPVTIHPGQNTISIDGD